MKKKETATKATTTKKAYAKTETPVEKQQQTVEQVETEEVEEQVETKGGIPRHNLPAFTNRIPDHTLAVALLVKNNAEIKRFTALNILNYLLQKGIIKGEHRYVVFKFDKFAVKCNGLTREFAYTEPFFINALVSAFTCLAHSAQKVIDTFVNAEITNVEQINSDEQSAMIAETSKNI